MRAGDVLFAAAQARLTLKAGKTEDTLRAYPAARLTSELATVIKEHETAIIQVLREDELMRRYIRAVRGPPIYRSANIGAPFPMFAIPEPLRGRNTGLSAYTRAHSSGPNSRAGTVGAYYAGAVPLWPIPQKRNIGTYIGAW